MTTFTEFKEETIVKEQGQLNHEIVLYNDDVNTFDHVIECLIKYCQHEIGRAHV